MFCKYCGTKIDNDAIFCSACGKKLAEVQPEPAPQPDFPEMPKFEAAPQPDFPEMPKFEAAPQPDFPEMPKFEAVPQPKTSMPFNLFALIAAAALGFFRFIEVIRGIAGVYTGISTLANLIAVGAAVLVVLVQFEVLKPKNLFYAIAMFALAFAEMLWSNGILWYISALTMPAYAIAGVHYLLKGKVFNNMIKAIMAFAVWTMGFILVIALIGLHLNFYTIFSAITTSAAGGLLILSYSPNK